MYKLDRNGITKANKHFWKPKIDKFPAHINEKIKHRTSTNHQFTNSN